MKLICLFLCFTTCFAFAEHSYAQSTKLSLHLNDVAVSDALEIIEKNATFHFFYNNTLIDMDRKVSVKAENKDVFTILDIIFKDTDVRYKVIDHDIILTAASLISQGGILVTGVVTDESGGPMPGVNVVIKGTATGQVTNYDGKFTITVPNKESVLVFSFVGYNSQEILVGDQLLINVTLLENTREIEEVVVVGYGIQKKVNLTGSISSVKMKELVNRPITNSSQALQGVPGLYVNQAGGQPGKDNATIRVRGQGTLNNNDPLVLVDGVEYPLSAVNPKDIESISVLKDAASSSIYGNRAANGVILVTTKQGTQGTAKIEYSNYFGVQRPTYLPDVVTDPVEFMKLRNQAQLNSGRLTVDYSDATIAEYEQGRLVDPYVYPANDWLDIMFNDAFMQEHNLRFSGGKDKANYALSLGYQSQDGVLMGSNSDQFSVRANVNFQLKDWIRVGSDFSMMRNYIQEPSTTAASLMEMVFKAQGFHPTYLEDGRYANTWVRTPGHNVYRHPIVWAKEGYLKNTAYRTLMSVYTDISLPAGIKYFGKIAASKYDRLQEQFVPNIYYYQVKTLEASRVDYYTDNKNRHVTNRDDNNINLTLYQTLSWDKSFDQKHNLKVLLGSSYESFEERWFNATVEGFLGNNLYEINAGSTNPSVAGTSARNYLIGFFGRVNYDYMQKYLFEANLRYDGSSKFAKGNRWGLFPSFSAGWRIDQESFMQDLSWIYSLKLRGSYGSLGNERIGNFKYVNTMDIGKEYILGGAVNPGVAVTAYNDPNITWETTTISNIGVDVSLFSNKLSFSFELYNKVTSDILREVNLPAQVGNLTGPVMNIGKVANKGIELIVGHQHSFGDFGYRVDGGLSYNTNKVKSLNGQVIYNGKFITKEGYPIDSYYILESDGIFQNQPEIDSSPFQNITTKPGYLKYKNQNPKEDNEINQDDRIITGSVNPKYTYDFTINLSWKNWAVTGFFQGVYGVKTYPESSIVATPFWFGCSVTKDWVNNSWTPERPNATLPIMTTFEESQNDNFMLSDFWLLDASYMRLKNLQISYNVPATFLSKFGLKSLLLFVNGQNLFTFTKMKDFDPERNIKQTNYYEYPSVKIFSAGLNVAF